MKNTRFAIDDEVRLVSSKTTVGTIKQIVSILADGNTLYLVDFPHGLKMVAEHELEFFEKLKKYGRDMIINVKYPKEKLR